jgi:hypothetical protein
MSMLTFPWEVCVDGYEIRANDHGMRFVTPRSVMKRAPRFAAIEPLRLNEKLFQQFATLEPTESAFLDFAGKFGLLTHNREPEPVATWMVERDNLRLAFSYWSQGLAGDVERLVNSLPFAALRIRIRDGMPAFEPTDLRAGLWAQLAMSVRKGEQHRACARCGTTFSFGPGTGRRSTAEFCSARCKLAANYQARKAAAAAPTPRPRRARGL